MAYRITRIGKRARWTLAVALAQSVKDGQAMLVGERLAELGVHRKDGLQFDRGRTCFIIRLHEFIYTVLIPTRASGPHCNSRRVMY